MQVLTPNGTLNIGAGREVMPSWVTSDHGVPFTSYSSSPTDPWKIWRTQHSVRKVVGYAARQIAQLPWHAYQRAGDDDRRRLHDSPAERALKAPSRFVGGYMLIEQIVIDAMLYDRFAVLLEDGELLRLPPRSWSVKSDWLGRPTQVVLHTPSGNPDIDLTDAPLAVGWGWADGVAGGISPLVTLAEILDESAKSVEWRKRQWDERPKFGGLLKHPAKFRDTKAKETFMLTWREWRDGRKGTPLLEEGMEYVQPQTISPRDALDLEGRQLTDVEVASAFHIPPEMIGAREGNYSNMAAWRSMLFGPTLGPLITMLSQQINAGLVGHLDPRPGVYLEVSREAAVNGSLVEQASVLQTMTGAAFMSRAEARARLNLPYKEGTDDLIVPLNVLEGGQASPTDSGSQNRALTRSKFLGDDENGSDDDEDEDEEEDGRSALREALLSLLLAQERALQGESFDPEAFIEAWETRTAADILPALRHGARHAANQLLRQYPGSDWDPEVMEGYLEAMAETTASKITAGTATTIAEQDDRNHAFEVLRNTAVVWAATAIAEAMGYGGNKAADGIGLTSKTWVVTSSNPRSTHSAMNGQTVGIHELFSNGARWPGDYSLSADETAGCTCRCDYT